MKTGKSVRTLLLEKNIMTEEEIDKILDYKKMTIPGILDEEHMGRD